MKLVEYCPVCEKDVECEVAEGKTLRTHVGEDGETHAWMPLPKDWVIM